MYGNSENSRRAVGVRLSSRSIKPLQQSSQQHSSRNAPQQHPQSSRHSQQQPPPRLTQVPEDHCAAGNVLDCDQLLADQIRQDEEVAAFCEDFFAKFDEQPRAAKRTIVSAAPIVPAVTIVQDPSVQSVAVDDLTESDDIVLPGSLSPLSATLPSQEYAYLTTPAFTFSLQ